MNKFCLILLMFISFSCKKELVNSTAKIGDTVTASYNKTLNFDNDISLKITDLADSRCPKSVQCPWAGKVDITMNFSDKTNLTAVRVEFMNQASSQKFELSGQKYAVQVLEVSPYPESPSAINKSQYTVSLTLYKL